MMEWLSTKHPDWNVAEWIDDQAALLMKWGVPILSSTRMEWLPALKTDGLIVQTPGQLNEEQRQSLLTSTVPLLTTGRADVFDVPILAHLGLRAGEPDGGTRAGFHVARGDDAPPYDRPYLPPHSVIEASEDTQVEYTTEKTPLITLRANLAFWQPPDWSEAFNPFVPKYQLGSTFPHYRIAKLLHEMAREYGLSHLQQVERSQTIAFHLWRSGGEIYLLLGNLETGEFGDSRTPRTVHLYLSRDQLGLCSSEYELARVDATGERVVADDSTDKQWIVFQIQLPPEQSGLWVVRSGQGLG
jgi:hypothetical protein